MYEMLLNNLIEGNFLDHAKKNHMKNEKFKMNHLYFFVFLEASFKIFENRLEYLGIFFF